MRQILYVVGKFFAQWIYALSIQSKVIRPEMVYGPGGYILACTHVSHLEPFIMSILVKRRIDWMTRIEFYRWKTFRWFLDTVEAFPVNRCGVPVSAIRTAIRKAQAGRIVGIFPEGGVVRGSASACRGGTIKQGACLVSIRAGVPIIPCVILGTHRLNEIDPWLPFRRAKIWIAYGQPIEPPQNLPSQKAGRHIMATQLSNSFCTLYQELLKRYNLPDSMTP